MIMEGYKWVLDLELDGNGDIMFKFLHKYVDKDVKKALKSACVVVKGYRSYETGNISRKQLNFILKKHEKIFFEYGEA